MGKYLTVDEQATLIDVSCDGYILRFFTAASPVSYIMDVRDPAGSTQYMGFHTRVQTSVDTYILSQDENRVTIIHENTPSRVVISVSGNYDGDYSGTAYLTNSVSATYWFTIYPDRLFIHLEWVTETAAITLTNDPDDNGICRFFWVEGNLTSESGIYGTSSETQGAAASNNRPTENYIGFISDEINFISVDIEHTTANEPTWNQRHDYPVVDIVYGWYNGDVDPGTHTLTVMALFDSADRENDGGTFLDWDTDIDTNAVAVGTICEQSADSLRYYCHTAHTAGAGNEPPNASYWHEYRMTLGNQYKDLVMAAPTTGSEVTDLVIPADLASDGFAADGARHTEMAAEELAYTNDIARIGHVDVIHDPMITTDGSTERVIEHIKADDNAASSTVVATIGSNGNWETLENVNRNTSNDSISTDIDRGTGLDTADTYMIDHAVAVYDNAYFKQGTKQIWFTPQFGYDDAADQTIWSLYVDWMDYIQITYDAGNDRYELRVAWGAILLTLNGPAYSDNASLQQLTFIEASWDSDEDVCQLSINGAVVDSGTNTGTPSTGNAAYVMTAADCNTDADGTGQLPADIYIGDSKAIDGCLLPYGAYFTGNGAVDTDVAHSDISFLWQGADATPIGTDVTNDGGDYVTDGPIGTKAFDNSDAGDNASAATSGNISAAEGSLSFWFKPNSALGADCTLFYADAAFKIWWDDSDNDVVFTYNTDVLNMTTAFAAGDTNWHHICCQWKASDSLYIIVDGAVTSLLTGVDAAPTLDATMYFTADDADGTNRADVLMSDFFITDKMATPQIPVVLGAGPIYAPIREIS